MTKRINRTHLHPLFICFSIQAINTATSYSCSSLVSSPPAGIWCHLKKSHTHCLSLTDGNGYGSQISPVSQRYSSGRTLSSQKRCLPAALPPETMMVVCFSVTSLSATSDFQCYIHIRPLALYIFGIEHFLASSFQNMALAAQLTVVQTFPFIQNVIHTLFSCRWINIRAVILNAFC